MTVNNPDIKENQSSSLAFFSKMILTKSFNKWQVIKNEQKYTNVKYRLLCDILFTYLESDVLIYDAYIVCEPMEQSFHTTS